MGLPGPQTNQSVKLTNLMAGSLPNPLWKSGFLTHGLTVHGSPCLSGLSTSEPLPFLEADKNSCKGKQADILRRFQMPFYWGTPEAQGGSMLCPEGPPRLLEESGAVCHSGAPWECGT